MLRSIVQLIFLLLFALIFLVVALLLAAHFGYLGSKTHEWVELAWDYSVTHEALIDKAFGLVGATATLIISAFGVYKSWHFHEINLPTRLEKLSANWYKTVIRNRRKAIFELSLDDSIRNFALPSRSRLSRFASLIYNRDQARLRILPLKRKKLEGELAALAASYRRCQAELLTTYLELGSQTRVCDPDNAQAALDYFKMPLGANSDDLDALELAARQSLALGTSDPALEYLSRLVEATKAHDLLRHARALRFHAEILHEGSPAANTTARSNLESAITFLQEHTDSAIEPATRKRELGFANELLAKVLIRIPRYRLARNAIAKAKEYLGDLDRLKELETRARPPIG